MGPKYFSPIGVYSLGGLNTRIMDSTVITWIIIRLISVKNKAQADLVNLTSGKDPDTAIGLILPPLAPHHLIT